MKKLNKLFVEKKNNILSVFFTAGFPSLNDTTKVLKALESSGADFVEVGLPYSDPLADGETIQRSSAKALANGINLDIIFDQLLLVKDTNKLPIVIMGYFNQILKYGEEKFCAKCKECGVETLIIPDLPMIEYENHYKELFGKHGLSNVFLISPMTSEERIRKIDDMTDLFIYVVASSATTGAKNKLSDEQLKYFDRIKNMKLESPLMIGFGISDNNTFNNACKYANGAIVGSAFVSAISGVGTGDIDTVVRNWVEDIFSK